MLIPLQVEKIVPDENDRLVLVTAALRPCLIGERISDPVQATPCKGVVFVGPMTQKAGHYPQFIVIDFSSVTTLDSITLVPYVIWYNRKPFTVLQDLLEEISMSLV